MSLKILLLFVLNLFVTNVYALENNTIAITGNKQIDNIQDIVINIETNSNNILGISSNLIYDKEKLKLVSYYGNNDFDMTLGNSLILDASKRNNTETIIGTLKFKALNNFKSGEKTIIKLVDIDVTDGKNIFKVENSSFELEIPNEKKDGYLNLITINNEPIEGFDSRITEYEVIISDIEIVDIDCKTTSADIKVEGLGLKNVNDSDTFVITAVDNDNNEQKYTIKLIKNNNDSVLKTGLKILEINDIDIDFSNSIYNYDINVPYEIKELNIFAIPLQNDSIVKINNNKLEIGENTIVLDVNEPNGVITQYHINVFRNKKITNNLYIYFLIGAIILGMLSLLIYVNNKRKFN